MIQSGVKFRLLSDAYLLLRFRRSCLKPRGVNPRRIESAAGHYLIAVTARLLISAGLGLGDQCRLRSLDDDGFRHRVVGSQSQRGCLVKVRWIKLRCEVRCRCLVHRRVEYGACRVLVVLGLGLSLNGMQERGLMMGSLILALGEDRFERMSVRDLVVRSL